MYLNEHLTLFIVHVGVTATLAAAAIALFVWAIRQDRAEQRKRQRLAEADAIWARIKESQARWRPELTYPRYGDRLAQAQIDAAIMEFKTEAEIHGGQP